MFAQSGKEFLAHAAIEIEVGGGAREHGGAGVEAEHAGEGIVAIEDLAGDNGAHDAGEVALPKLAISFLGAAQSFLDFDAFGEVDGDAAKVNVAL